MKRAVLNAAFMILVATVVVLLARRRDPPPDRQHPSSSPSVSLSAQVSAAVANGDLLVRGPMDYVVVPLEWKLVDRDGKEQPIPPTPGQTTFHRLPATQALLANDGGSPDNGEAMMFTSLHKKGPVTAEMLDAYADAIAKASSDGGSAKLVAAKQMFKHDETGDIRGKVFVARPAPDGRVEIHYLIADRARDVWQLVYVTRKENAQKWRLILADLE